jgi:ankyrin repeat protein
MEAKNSLGQTPLLATYGVLEPRPEIRRLLIERGADINAGDENGITPLHHAVMGGTLAEVKSLVEKGAKVDAARKDGWTPLMNVQGAETDAIIRYLLEKGADVKVKPEGNFTILMAAAEGTSVETYRMLLDKVADTHLNVQNVHGETALDSVIGTREPEKVMLLLERGINPNTQANVVGTTPLMSLIQSAGNYEDRGEVLKLVQAMIDKGAKIGTRDSSGKTAMKLAQEAAWPELIAMLKKAGGKAVAATGAEELKRALDSGSLAAVKQVLAKGVDPNSVVLLDFTALTVASQSGKIELVRALLDKGADPNRRGKEDGALPLHTAADKGHAQIVQLLLKKGANPNLLAQGKTALMAALSKSEAAIAKLLLTSGASPKIKGEDGITTLMTAVFSDEQEIVSLLLSKGVDVNEINDLGSTALSIAASFGRPELTRLLLDKGAKVNVKDSGGNTPLHGAALATLGL